MQIQFKKTIINSIQKDKKGPRFLRRIASTRKWARSSCISLTRESRLLIDPKKQRPRTTTSSWRTSPSKSRRWRPPWRRSEYCHFFSGSWPKLVVKFHFFRGKWRFPVLGPSLRDLISSYRHGSHEKASTAPWPPTPGVQSVASPISNSTMSSNRSDFKTSFQFFYRTPALRGGPFSWRTGRCVIPEKKILR